MTVNVVKNSNNNVSYIASTDVNPQVGLVSELPETAGDATQDSRNAVNRNELLKITEEMNKSMQLLNVDIQFSLHEKTQTLMVQIVDVATDKVIKEFPPHELLDTKAKIREYIGILLDKKA